MPRRPTTRKPSLRKPTLRKKTVRKRKVATQKRKTVIRKKIARKAQASKRQAVTRKAVLHKKTVRKVTARRATASKRRLAKPRDRIGRVEADLGRLSDEHKTTRIDLDETRAILKKTTANLDKLGVNLDKLGVEVDKTVAGIHELRKSVGGLDGKWGDFSEALLIGDVEEALNKFEGIKVTARHPNVRVTYEGQRWEIDCLAVGDDMVVVVEAKASLTKGHIGKFIGNILIRFTSMFPAYRGKKIYGAVGYLNAKDEVVTFAQSKGLLVMHSVHETKELVNVPSKFKLRNFHP